MAEYIEREAVEKMLEDADLISDGEYSGYCTDDVCLNDIPAADVAPIKHGKWIVVGSREDGTVCKCSECGEMFSFNGNAYFPKYCDCGAKMDETEGE